MNCPACGYYNPPAQSCFHCSLPLPIPAGDALCAVHPDTRATGACSRCGTFGCGACLVAHAADWLCPKCVAHVSKLPWDERQSLGLWRSWWRTSVMMISTPNQSLAAAEPDAPLASSVMFSLVSGLVGYGPTVVLAVPLGILGEFNDPKMAAGSLPQAAVVAAVLTMLYLGLAAAYQAGSVLFLSALEHLGLMLVGANPRSYTVTVRAHALSTAPYLVGLMPGCGLSVFPLWSLVLRMVANLHLHKTTGGKAVGAILLSMVGLSGLVGLFFVVVLALAMGFAR